MLFGVYNVRHVAVPLLPLAFAYREGAPAPLHDANASALKP